MERCLASEADSGRHPWSGAAFPQAACARQHKPVATPIVVVLGSTFPVAVNDPESG
jgi:hypothetical protein